VYNILLTTAKISEIRTAKISEIRVVRGRKEQDQLKAPLIIEMIPCMGKKLFDTLRRAA